MSRSRFTSFLIFVAISTAGQRAYSQEPGREKLCPTISVSCPDSDNESALTFSVNVAGPRDKLNFKWSISNGKLVSGQGTSSITVDASDFLGQTVTATIEVGGLPDKLCPNIASCSVGICGLVKAWKFDEYGDLSLKDEEARLDKFAAELQKDGARVFVPPDLMNQALTTIKNRRLRLSDYSNRIIVVNFFASWCGPCRVNLTDLVSLQNHYKAHRIKIIGLVWGKNDPDLKRVREFVHEQKINFQVVWYKDDFGELLQKLVNGRSVIPQTFVIGRDGRIRKHYMGFSQTNTPKMLREALDQVGQEMESPNATKSPQSDRPR